MHHKLELRAAYTLIAACTLALVAGCGGGGSPDEPATASAAAVGLFGSATLPDAVSAWATVAATTINQPNAATGTPEERQSIYSIDLATLHIAMYDAAVAISGSHQPFYATSPLAANGASIDAAIAAAAYGVLKGLFPSRLATYQPLYDEQLARLPEGVTTAKGLALGADIAARVLAARANDGRAVALAPFVAGSGPGQFRGPAIGGRSYPFVRPFALSNAAQFRPAAPPATHSAAYAADYDETRLLGGATSTMRTAEQATQARFHTEPPFTFWPRNLGRFMPPHRNSPVEQARLGALLWVTHADASIACFEAKYHYLFWRPFSAINLGASDGNDATVADPTWTSFLPTPPHPEYPAAHACVAGAIATVLAAFYGTTQIAYDFDSKASATWQHYDSTDALVADVRAARILGGMHFRSATVAGAALGKDVSEWVLSQKFQQLPAPGQR